VSHLKVIRNNRSTVQRNIIPNNKINQITNNKLYTTKTRKSTQIKVKNVSN